MPLTKHRHTCAHRNGRQPTCLSDHADGDCQGKEVSMHPGFCTAPTREAEDSRHLMSGARPYDAGLVSPRLLCPIRTRRVCVEELQKQCSFKKKRGGPSDSPEERSWFPAPSALGCAKAHTQPDQGIDQGVLKVPSRLLPKAVQSPENDVWLTVYDAKKSLEKSHS